MAGHSKPGSARPPRGSSSGEWLCVYRLSGQYARRQHTSGRDCEGLPADGDECAVQGDALSRSGGFTRLSGRDWPFARLSKALGPLPVSDETFLRWYTTKLDAHAEAEEVRFEVRLALLVCERML